MRVLITGGAGLLGSTLLSTQPTGWEVLATQRSRRVANAPPDRVVEIDLADPMRVLATWERLRPDLVIHTAYSAENGEREIYQATVNVTMACKVVRAALIHMSTDALFDGETGPYAEHAEPSPVHEYGTWKARAETNVRLVVPGAAVIRTSLITSFAPLDPRSAWVADALRAGEPITLFVDELRCPMSPRDLALQLWEIAALPPGSRTGVWHLAGPEALSRYALGVLIAAHEGLDPRGITPAFSRDSPTPRPRDVRLLTGRADRELRHRPRPVSALCAPAPSAG